MDSKTTFDNYHFYIGDEICNECSTEGLFYITVNNQLKSEYPEQMAVLEDISSYKGVPANHSFWKRREELLEPYKTKCLVFEYDDLTEAICKRHLQEVLNRL